MVNTGKNLLTLQNNLQQMHLKLLQKAVNNTSKKVIFKNCAPSTSCLIKINYTQVDNAEDIDIELPVYKLTKYSDTYSKILESLWQYCRKKPAFIENNSNITDFPVHNSNSNSFKFKNQITRQIGNNDTKDVKIMVPLKYLRNFGEHLKCLK